VSTRLTAEQLALVEQRLRGARPSPAPVIPVAPDGPAPLSAEQQQLVWHTWMVPGNPIYHECITLIHRGELDVAALRSALDALVARHDVWHSTFERRARQLVQVVGPAPTHELPVHDLRGAPPEALGELVAGVSLAPYDLAQGPLVRPVLVRTADDEHRLFLAMHHLVFDGVSLYRIVLPELAALYDAAVAGRPSPLPPTVQYRDYATWQAAGVLDAELERHLPWWREHLEDAPTLALPLDHERPEVPRYAGRTTWFEIPAADVEALRAAGHARGATFFHLLATAWTLVLRDLTGQDDLVFATVADRRSRPELRTMMGYCVTPAPLRVRLPPGAGVDEVLDAVRTEVLDVLSHNVPFERIVGDLNPAHPVGTSPVFQAMVVLEPVAEQLHPQWSMHPLDPSIGGALGHAKNDLHLELDERPDGHLSCRLITNRDIFDEPFADAFAASYARVVASLT